MAYSLEDSIEAERLEEQVFEQNYNIAQELKDLNVSFSGNILDGGSGTGVLCRYINSHYQIEKVDGLEFSALRIRQAQDLLSATEKSKISFFEGDLLNINSDFYEKYDHVVSRYVLEHLVDAPQALQQLIKCLKPGGTLSIIELDGVFFNLFSLDPQFNRYMDKLKSEVQFDLSVGKKIPALMYDLGLKNIQWEAQLVSCQGKSLDEEIKNTQKRFQALKNFLLNFFGNEKETEEFEKVYLEEMHKSWNTLTFTKYICKGVKF
ncbi:MAG: class I SAM-dependent methyltransferase [Halobacteriovoraceae bacterium]|nr:class I SAM-dependent methyltransferase [Halobacteriovoraceae bacterium]MCB9095837.1 class I SAM-dependent methyltransferase [Halobacteriovoraceae bacterium]